MSETKIFVSSTCYDLGAVREDLRRYIIQLGHEPLLSEFPSFPINPDETTIQNCKRNVEIHTDVFVLIVGGRRGALDVKSGKSVTNLEYDSARLRGIPCFVFISQPVLTLLHVWKKNPTADFTPAVDYPEVFAFVERIRNENRWTFPFEKTIDIENCLGFQLSVMLRELLARNRAGTLDPVVNFQGESLQAQKIVREKPRYWEYRLTAELLKNKLGEVRRQFERQRAGLMHVPAKLISGKEFIDWVSARVEDMGLIVKALQNQILVIQNSWGPPGVAGNSDEIKTSVDEFNQLCQQLVEWEKDVQATRPPEAFRRLKDSMKGWTEVVLKEMERLPVELSKPFEGDADPKGQLDILLSIGSPSFEGFHAELEAIKLKNPRILL